ncbi:MAG: ATP-binding protein [Candidatus Nitrotoga sp.]
MMSRDILPHLARYVKSGHSIVMLTIPLLASDSSVLNLQRLMMLRGVFIAGQILAVWVASSALDVSLSLFAIGMIIVTYAMLNALTWWRLRLPHTVVDAELFCHLLLDVAVLTGLLYLAGGSENPFVSLLLLPLTITVTALPGRYSWAMAVITVACYSSLMVFYVPLSHTSMSHVAGDFALHVLGMWFNFVLSVGLITYFVMRMGNTLRERDRALAQARENTLRDERLVALGTLATGAAHELGTPLATMAVLTREMEQEFANTPDVRNKLTVLRDQVMRCKSILSTMAASAGQVRAESGQKFALDDYLQNILQQWQAMRPAVIVQYHAHGTHPAPSIVGDQTLSQAIINILNNAADASPDQVTVDAQWSVNELRMEICDRGTGLTPTTQARAGQMLFTTKISDQAGDEMSVGGLGLGLFLARATLGRLGGSVQLRSREGGGACTYVVLPLAPLIALSPSI